MDNSVWPQTTTNPTPEIPAGMTESTSTEPVLSPAASSALEALFSRTQGKPIEQGQILPLLTQMGVVNPGVQKEVVGYIFPGAKVAPDSNFDTAVIRPEPIKPVDYESTIPEAKSPAPGRKTLADLRMERIGGGVQNTVQPPIPEPAVAPPPIAIVAENGAPSPLLNGTNRTLENIQSNNSPNATVFQSGEPLGSEEETITDPNQGAIIAPNIDNTTPGQMAEQDLATLGIKPETPITEETDQGAEAIPEPVPVTVNKPEIIKPTVPETSPVIPKSAPPIPNITKEPTATDSVAETIETSVPPKRSFLQRLFGLGPKNPIEDASHAAMMTEQAQKNWENTDKQ